MAKTPKGPTVPKDYRPLEGSERHPSPKAEFLGPADENEQLSVTIVLRRRMPEDGFAAKYGAAADDLERVTAFARAHGLTVVETNAARRAFRRVTLPPVPQAPQPFAIGTRPIQGRTERARRTAPG